MRPAAGTVGSSQYLGLYVACHDQNLNSLDVARLVHDIRKALCSEFVKQCDGHPV